MAHNLEICLAPESADGSVASVHKVSIRERLLRFFFGGRQKLTIIVPGDSVQELAIHEVVLTKGESA